MRDSDQPIMRHAITGDYELECLSLGWKISDDCLIPPDFSGQLTRDVNGDVVLKIEKNTSAAPRSSP